MPEGPKGSGWSHFPHSKGYRAAVFLLASASVVLAVLRLVTNLAKPGAAARGIVDDVALPIILGLTGVYWFWSFARLQRRYVVSIGTDRIQTGRLKSGDGQPKGELLYEDLAGLNRPGSPKGVVLKSKDGGVIQVPASHLSKDDWANFIVRLREVMAGRFTIPEEW